MKLTRKRGMYDTCYELVGMKNNCKITIHCDRFKKEFYW